MGQLTDDRVERILEKGRYSDGRRAYGLALLVRESADGGVRKSWVQRVRKADGKPTQIGLGAYPLIDLTTARARAFVNAQEIERSRYSARTYPVFTSPTTPTLVPVIPQPEALASVPTFSDLATDYLEYLSATRAARTIKSYQSLLNNWQLPAIGDLPVNTIQANDILGFIKSRWSNSYPTASKALMLTKAIMKYAEAHDYIEASPVPRAEKALIKINHDIKHAEFIRWQEMSSAFETIAQCGSHLSTKLAFVFLYLTGARIGALTGFEWEDIKENGTGFYLHIPEDREGQKTAAGFKIPLSAQAMRLLEVARLGATETGNIFNIGKRAIGTMMMRRGLVEGITAHGSRTTFTTWAQEATEYPKDLIDECLAHTVNNSVQAAYFQSDRVERRRAVMQDYADEILPMDTLNEWIIKVMTRQGKIRKSTKIAV